MYDSVALRATMKRCDEDLWVLKKVCYKSKNSLSRLRSFKLLRQAMVDFRVTRQTVMEVVKVIVEFSNVTDLQATQTRSVRLGNLTKILSLRSKRAERSVMRAFEIFFEQIRGGLFLPFSLTAFASLARLGRGLSSITETVSRELTNAPIARKTPTDVEQCVITDILCSNVTENVTRSDNFISKALKSSTTTVAAGEEPMKPTKCSGNNDHLPLDKKAFLEEIFSDPLGDGGSLKIKRKRPNQFTFQEKEDTKTTDSQVIDEVPTFF